MNKKLVLILYDSSVRLTYLFTCMTHVGLNEETSWVLILPQEVIIYDLNAIS